MASRERAIVNNLNERARFYGAMGELDIYVIRALLDFYDHTCLKCGKRPATSPDHVIPLVSGGDNLLPNLQLLCVDCQKEKGDSDTDYRNGLICPTNHKLEDDANKRKQHRWKPGESGNPKGRPSAGMSWGELIKTEGAKYNEDLGITRKEYLVMCAFDHAENGNAMILKELFQRSEPVDDNLNVNLNDNRTATPEERRARLAELIERVGGKRTTLVA
jgi:hypothetical protein